MTPEYRKLPGKRRGFLNVSSVWAGEDHLLLVRGTRFREEYKRFYFRDVQAIVVAKAPRFHVSTRSGLIAALALMAGLIFVLRHRGPAINTWAGGWLSILALAVVWAVISATQSCRCRIYTGVSADELPSVYRVWTARKFLASVEPLIARTQGKIEGEWAMAAEARAVGPVAGLAAGSPSVAGPKHEGPGLPRRVLASDLFLACMAMDALMKILPLFQGLQGSVAVELLTIASAVGVIVQYNRGRLRAGMHRVAVAALIAFGLLYYVESGAAGFSAAMTAAKTGKKTVAVYPQWPLARKIGAGMDAILIIVGLIVSLRDDEEPRSGLLTE